MVGKSRRARGNLEPLCPKWVRRPFHFECIANLGQFWLHPASLRYTLPISVPLLLSDNRSKVTSQCLFRPSSASSGTIISPLLSLSFSHTHTHTHSLSFFFLSSLSISKVVYLFSFVFRSLLISLYSTGSHPILVFITLLLVESVWSSIIPVLPGVSVIAIESRSLVRRSTSDERHGVRCSVAWPRWKLLVC